MNRDPLVNKDFVWGVFDIGRDESHLTYIYSGIEPMVYEIFVGDTKLGQFSKLSSLLQLRYVLNDLHASD
jgi:hypothetical protein